MIPLSPSTLPRLLPLRQHRWGFAICQVITTAPPLIKETLAGMLSGYSGRQAIFSQGLLPCHRTISLVLARLPLRRTTLEAPAQAGRSGMLFVATAIAALGQGQRLDRFSSGWIVGLFSTAATPLAGFVWHSLVTPTPLPDLRLLTYGKSSCGLLGMFAFSFAGLGPAFSLPGLEPGSGASANCRWKASWLLTYGWLGVLTFSELLIVVVMGKCGCPLRRRCPVWRLPRPLPVHG